MINDRLMIAFQHAYSIHTVVLRFERVLDRVELIGALDVFWNSPFFS